MYYCLQDPNTPLWVKVIIIAALGYFISPIDAVPDVLPFVGYGDDATAIAGAFSAIASNIKICNELPEFGEITNININSVKKNINIRLMLNGESIPVDISINSYKIIQLDGTNYITFSSVSTSKPWINALICKFVPAEKRIPLNSRLVAWIIKILF